MDPKIITEVKKFMSECQEVKTGITDIVTDIVRTLNNDKDIFQKLNSYFEYFEINPLIKDHLPTSYLDIQYKLKEIALKTTEDIGQDDREEAFYKWLRICVNPQNDPDIEHYFKVRRLNKEDEVQEILFEKNGEIREIFVGKDTWQIRFRKIMAWFLKRYDISTARKIHRSIRKTSWFESVDLLFPRLFGSIFIGFLPLMAEQKIWELPTQLHWMVLLVVVTAAPLLSFFYFKMEYYKTTGKCDYRRPLKVFCIGLLYSITFSLIFTTLFSKHFIEKGSYFLDLGDVFRFYPEVFSFFAAAAYLIGIFLQILWEEKTVTEPL